MDFPSGSMVKNIKMLEDVEDPDRVITVMVSPKQGPDQKISYTNLYFIGSGTFGKVYRAKLCDTAETVAIKKILENDKIKTRELLILRNLEHCNVVKLKYFFRSEVKTLGRVYLNLILEYVPKTLHKILRNCRALKQNAPMILVKVFTYQIFRSLAYIHSLDICHRDVKPNNILVDPMTCIVKLCDFGSAKRLIQEEINTSYICSRQYRAPELLFGASHYTTAVDVWSAGCVLAELLLGKHIFSGTTTINQLYSIMNVLGTPTKDEIIQMNPNHRIFNYSKINSLSWQEVFGARAPSEAIQLISNLLQYSPSSRFRSLQACAHSFFDELRESNTRLPGDRVLPPLFNFTEQELNIDPSLNSKLIPKGVNGASNNPQDEAGTSTMGDISDSSSGPDQSPSTSKA